MCDWKKLLNSAERTLINTGFSLIVPLPIFRVVSGPLNGYKIHLSLVRNGTSIALF